MNKVRIWNREITACDECPYWNEYESCPCPFLPRQILNLTIGVDEITKIDSNCPFLQPITKEVIKGFGFSILNNHIGVYNKFDKNSDTTYFIVDYLNTNIRIGIDNGMCQSEITLFRGTINNPQELEFILKSLNII